MTVFGDARLPERFWTKVRLDCKRDHAFTPENTYVSPDGRRRTCRTCQNAKSERQRRARGMKPRQFGNRAGAAA